MQCLSFSEGQKERPPLKTQGPSPVPAPKGPFVTVFQDLELTRMQVARSMLEASGLFCRLADEAMAGAFPRSAAVIARLQVPESQARLAKEILEGMKR